MTPSQPARAPLTTYAGGHLGALVAPLVDGQLRPSTAERAWNHVLRCGVCTESVRRQTWVKNQLLLTCAEEPPAPASLAERLCALPDSLTECPSQDLAARREREHVAHGWPGSARARTAAVAGVGVGGLSAAAFVVASWVGLPAVSGPVPVQADLNPSTSVPGGPGAALVEAIHTEQQRRVGRP